MKGSSEVFVTLVGDDKIVHSTIVQCGQYTSEWAFALDAETEFFYVLYRNVGDGRDDTDTTWRVAWKDNDTDRARKYYIDNVLDVKSDQMTEEIAERLAQIDAEEKARVARWQEEHAVACM